MTWLNEAGGEDGSGWTANRSYTIRTSRRGEYGVRVTAVVRGGAAGGGVVTSIEDSETVQIHTGMYIRMLSCGVKSVLNSSFTSYSVQAIPQLKEQRLIPVLESNFMLAVSMTTLLAMQWPGLGMEVGLEMVTNYILWEVTYLKSKMSLETSSPMLSQPSSVLLL